MAITISEGERTGVREHSDLARARHVLKHVWRKEAVERMPGCPLEQTARNIRCAINPHSRRDRAYRRRLKAPLFSRRRLQAIRISAARGRKATIGWDQVPLRDGRCRDGRRPHAVTTAFDLVEVARRATRHRQHTQQGSGWLLVGCIFGAIAVATQQDYGPDR